MSVTSFDSSLVSALGRSLQPKYKLCPSSGKQTPGTSTSSRSLRSYTIISIYEGRGAEKGTIGMAVLDLRYPEVNIYEFIDSTSYLRLTTKLQIEDPIEILVAESINEKRTTLLLIEAIKGALEDPTITTVNKRYFNEQRASDLVQRLANVEVSNCDDVTIKKRRYAIAACGGLLKYIEFIQNIVFSGKSLKITFQDVEKICMIDKSSWKCLELIDTAEMSVTKQIRRSLLSVIDYTLTPSGFRFLRSNLLQPSADRKVLEDRYDTVEELVENSHLLERIRGILAHIFELDSVLAICSLPPKNTDTSQCEMSINQLQRLRTTLDLIRPLRKCLIDVKSESLRLMKTKLEDSRLDQIIDILDTTMDITALNVLKKNSLTLRNQKCYAIKPGVCINLDVARKTYEELLTDLQDGNATKELEEHLPNENTRMAYSISRGFHYVWVCNKPSYAKIPSVFRNWIRHRHSITFTSKQLIRYNDRINQCVAEIMLASSIIIYNLIDQIRDLIPVLYNIMECSANLDFLCSLAIYSSNTETVRPILGQTLMFKEGRHPLLDFHAHDECVSNDTYLTPEANFGIITGPNMGGKSTYLRQVCQLSILAQVGCMVPAEIAIIPVYTRMFSRVGHNDNVSKGLSAFAVEMNEMAVILQYADMRSLIIIDELARSTSTEEGLGISYAIAEYLVQKKAYVLLATHFLDLCSLNEKYIVVENYHFMPQTKIDNNGNENFNATHKLYRGPYTGPLYGFELIGLSTFPTSVIENARKLADKLKSESDKKGDIPFDAARRKLLVRTALRLRQSLTFKKTCCREDMIKHLVNIRKGFNKKLYEIEKNFENQDEPPEGEAVSDANF